MATETTVGMLRDTKGIEVSVIKFQLRPLTEPVHNPEPRVWIKAKPEPWYKNPSPHLNAEMAEQVIEWLIEAGAVPQEPPVEEGHTERGFSYWTPFPDASGHEVWVQESSAAGRPCCWVFTDGAASPNLTLEQAGQLVLCLRAFVADSRDENNWRNDPGYIENWG